MSAIMSKIRFDETAALSIPENFKLDARWNFKGNVKLGGKIASFSKLAGDGVFQTKYGEVRGTCGRHCKGCGESVNGQLPPCYVFKSYRYDSVVNGHARNTLSFRKDLWESCKQLSGALQRKKTPVEIARWDQSGELLPGEIQGLAMIAGENKDTRFYVYTKCYDEVIQALQAGIVPDNLTILISVWHENGIEAFQAVKDYENVKAFVYVDGDKDGGWTAEDYAKHGLQIGTFCKAYGRDGKLDHDITCQRCQKCFNRLASHKVIGCYDH